jgi:hypothetical protein
MYTTLVKMIMLDLLAIVDVTVLLDKMLITCGLGSIVDLCQNVFN